MWRHRQLLKLRADPAQLEMAHEFYRQPAHAADFIHDWGMIHEPRDAFNDDSSPLIPFIPFNRQREMIQFVVECLFDRERGLIEKSRDMGATWICVWISIWLWRYYPGASIGWGSQEAKKVDQLGDPSSIFEKIRIGIEQLPDEFKPEGFSDKNDMMQMRILNRSNGASIMGDVGDSIGRGGRTLITFKDESAHYLHDEKIEASLSMNCQVQIDMSSVYGTNTMFHRRREAGVEWYPGAKLQKGRTRVFVFDWHDHPGKTQQWYDLLRAEHERTGTLHILAQEVDRDYSAAVEGVIIPALWVERCVDAHLQLKFKDDGNYAAALDIADEGGDLNALVTRRGPILKTADDWGERDTGVTTRRVIAACRPCGRIDVQYDASGGYGSGVKAEANRLIEENLMPKTIRLIPWLAGGEVLDKDSRFIKGDPNSPTNGELFQNLKAQAWWALRRRFELTFRALTEPNFTYDEDDLISIPSSLPNKFKLMKELSQAVMIQSTKLKMVVDKKPDGAKSPNLADAAVMCFFPMRTHKLMRFTKEILDRARMPSGVMGRWT